MSAYWSSFRDPTSGYALVVLGRIGTPPPKLRLNLLASFAQDDSLWGYKMKSVKSRRAMRAPTGFCPLPRKSVTAETQILHNVRTLSVGRGLAPAEARPAAPCNQCGAARCAFREYSPALTPGLPGRIGQIFFYLFTKKPKKIGRAR